MNYQLVEATEERVGVACAKLNKEVYEMLQQGWELYGDPIITTIPWVEGGRRLIIAAQAMIDLRAERAEVREKDRARRNMKIGNLGL